LVSILAAIVVLLAGLGFFLEATFRPREAAAIAVAADLGHLQGRISEPTGWMPMVLPGVAGAEVALTPGDHQTVTDADGYFSIPGIVPGVYTLTVTAAGFETAVMEGTAIPGGRITTLPDEALFPAIEGPPRASLKVGSLMPFGEPPASHPYMTGVYIDATDSANISRYGIRFEIRDEAGALLMDPWSNDGEPLQPERSAVPGTPPTLFSFEPPRPGTYTVKIILTNHKVPGAEDSAEVTVRAVNTAPEAFPTVMSGPDLPNRMPAGGARASSGLKVVHSGRDVFLKGLGLDKNHASPERYNKDGLAPDIYGKNNDHLQRQFGFRWQLFHVDQESGSRTPLHHLLRDADNDPATEGQVLHFTPDRPGHFDAVLEVLDQDAFGSLASEPASVSVLVVDDTETYDGTACAECHTVQVEGYDRTAHRNAGIGCENCHGPAVAHLAAREGDGEFGQTKQSTQDISHESGVCGQCHTEYSEWEKSRHSDGMPFGYHEIGRPLLVQCSKCHYAKTFKAALDAASDAGIAFHDVDYKIRAGGIGPLMADMSKVAEKDATGMSCTTCHNPHESIKGESVGLRTGDPGALCQTCHEEKWQNTVLEGTSGEVRNGYEYPGEDYELDNPHNTGRKCTLCHVGDQTEVFDARGVRVVGGHTLRMRDAGPNQVVGGFGPRPDDVTQDKDPAESDDVLHLAACRQCHGSVDSFDVNGLRSEVHARWMVLGDLLRSTNSGILPDYKPGDKCATCHRGGTLPFDDDPNLVLENAYTNYKLIKNDRSWGVHNPKYTRKLLTDSIAAIEAYLRAHGQAES